MGGFAAILAVTAPLMMANDERGLFHFPGSEDAWRIQKIERTGNEREWPFSGASGYLMCVWIFGDKVVYFAEPPPREGNDFERVVLVSTNPFDLMVVNIGKNDVFIPFGGMEQMIQGLAPFVNLGRRLCDQPRGTEIGPGEL